MRAATSSCGGGCSAFVTRMFIPRELNEDIVLMTELELILLDEELEEWLLRYPWLEGAGEFSLCPGDAASHRTPDMDFCC